MDPIQSIWTETHTLFSEAHSEIPHPPYVCHPWTSHGGRPRCPQSQARECEEEVHSSQREHTREGTARNPTATSHRWPWIRITGELVQNSDPWASPGRGLGNAECSPGALGRSKHWSPSPPTAPGFGKPLGSSRLTLCRVEKAQAWRSGQHPHRPTGDPRQASALPGPQLTPLQNGKIVLGYLLSNNPSNSQLLPF